MRLHITHSTRYQYDEPVDYALQQLRMVPKQSTGQAVIDWAIKIEGGKRELGYMDYHRNHVDLISFERGATSITITSGGEVDVSLSNGIVGPHIGVAPLWLFMRQTPLTKPGPGIRRLATQLVTGTRGDVAHLHALSAAIGESVTYKTGETDSITTAEQAFSGQAGVCQDHAHIFLSAARLLGYPARYVSGYLMMNDRIDQNASHAWAEVHLPELGWVGFDVSNGICPDERYIRVATGLDYKEAAPASGMRYGNSQENMIVSLQVQQ